MRYKIIEGSIPHVESHLNSVENKNYEIVSMVSKGPGEIYVIIRKNDSNVEIKLNKVEQKQGFFKRLFG